MLVEYTSDRRIWFTASTISRGNKHVYSLSKHKQCAARLCKSVRLSANSHNLTSHRLCLV